MFHYFAASYMISGWLGRHTGLKTKHTHTTPFRPRFASRTLSHVERGPKSIEHADAPDLAPIQSAPRFRLHARRGRGAVQTWAHFPMKGRAVLRTLRTDVSKTSAQDVSRMSCDDVPWMSARGLPRTCAPEVLRTSDTRPRPRAFSLRGCDCGRFRTRSGAFLSVSHSLLSSRFREHTSSRKSTTLHFAQKLRRTGKKAKVSPVAPKHSHQAGASRQVTKNARVGVRGREDGNGCIASDPTHLAPCHTVLNLTPNEPLSSRLIEKQRVFSAIRQFTNTPRLKKKKITIHSKCFYYYYYHHHHCYIYV